MKKSVTALLVLVIVLLPLSSLAATLETTELVFEMTYTYVMGRFKQSCSYALLSSSNENGIETHAVSLNDYSAALFTIKDSEIAGIIHVGSGDGTESSGLAVTCSMIATMMAVDPSITLDNAVDVLSALQESGSYATNYCTYQYSYDSSVGAVMTIQPA